MHGFIRSRDPTEGCDHLYQRGVAQSCLVGINSGCLRRLFLGSPTTRTLLDSRPDAPDITVLEDKRIIVNGADNGVRKSVNLWNTFSKSKGSAQMKMEVNQITGDLTGGLQESSTCQYVYVVDVFQYGLLTKDAPILDSIPKAGVDPAFSSDGYTPATSRSSSSSKKQKMEDAPMTDPSAAQAWFDKLSAKEDVSAGARVSSDLRIYWYDPS